MKIVTDGETKALSANESHVFEMADSTRLKIAVPVPCVAAVSETMRSWRTSVPTLERGPQSSDLIRG